MSLNNAPRKLLLLYDLTKYQMDKVNIGTLFDNDTNSKYWRPVKNFTRKVENQI